MTSTRGPAIAAITASTLIIAVLAIPLARDTVEFGGDLGRYHLPLRAFYAECLRTGESPLWWPELACGFPIHGEGQGGFFHPLHQLLYRTLPLTVAFNVEIWLPFPFALVGTYLWLWRVGFTAGGAWTGAATFAFGNFMLSHHVHVNAVGVFSHLPWLLWLATVAYGDASASVRAACYAGIALLTASQWLLGYPQYVWLSSFTAVWWGLYLLAGERRWGRAAHLIAAIAIGLLLGGLQFAPTLEALQLSPRVATDLAFRGDWSLQPGYVLGGFAPYLFGRNILAYEKAAYAGLLPLFGVAWWLAGGRGATPRLAKWAFGLIVVGVVLALGSHSPLFKLYARIPVLGVFRCPCRYLAVVAVGSAVFAAVFVDGVCRLVPRWPTAREWLALAAVPLFCAVAIVVIARSPGWQPGEHATRIPFLAGLPGFALMHLVGVCLIAGVRWRPLFAVGVALAIADLGLSGLPTLLLNGQVPPDAFVAAQVVPPQTTPHRIELADVDGNGSILRGQRLSEGYVGLSVTRLLDFHAPAVRRLSGVAWQHVVVVDDKGRITLDVWRSSHEPLSYARLMSESRVAVISRDLAGVDIDREVVLDSPLAVDGGPLGVVNLVERGPTWMKFRSSATGKRALVVAESYHHGWTATVNGGPVDVARAYGDFQAVAVPAGEAEVLFRFLPHSQRTGWLMTCAGVIGLALQVAVTAVAREKAPGGEPGASTGSRASGI